MNISGILILAIVAAFIYLVNHWHFRRREVRQKLMVYYRECYIAHRDSEHKETLPQVVYEFAALENFRNGFAAVSAPGDREAMETARESYIAAAEIFNTDMQKGIFVLIAALTRTQKFPLPQAK